MTDMTDWQARVEEAERQRDVLQRDKDVLVDTVEAALRYIERELAAALAENARLRDALDNATRPQMDAAPVENREKLTD